MECMRDSRGESTHHLVQQQQQQQTAITTVMTVANTAEPTAAPASNGATIPGRDKQWLGCYCALNNERAS